LRREWERAEVRSPRTRSLRLHERAVRRVPGGVNSSVRMDAPSIYFTRGQGAWLWDVDGNDYVDYLLGQGPAFLGHAPQAVLAAVERASREGMVFGSRHPLEVEAAELICDVLGWADMVRFGSTGTEMVQAALRLARAATGRRRFVRFEGHYHGWLDNLLMLIQDDRPVPASAGQVADHLADARVLPWNDLEAVTHVLEGEGEEIAAVLMEPMMLNAGSIAPRPGYLEGVRDLCRRRGALLVFDEVITGFRVGPGGAADRFGVAPDLAVYGKALASGWPVAALAGRADLMELLGGRVNHSGTFNSNVMAMAATVATLRQLKEEPPYERISHLGERLMNGLHDLASGRAPLRIQGLPMAFHASFGDEAEVWDYRALADLDSDGYRNLVSCLIEEGVWVAGRGIWYLSAAHGEREVEVTLERADAALARL
jgi:glutamate-1-semialdehyde 2,1-aminomutase